MPDVAARLLWQVPGVEVLALHRRLKWTGAWLAVQTETLYCKKSASFILPLRGAWAGQSRPLTRRLPLLQQALPQREAVVVRCSLPWTLFIVLLRAVSPLGTAGAPAAE